MARKKIAKEKEEEGDLEAVVKAFKPFAEEGYVLNPHSEEWTSSLFDKAWGRSLRASLF